MAATWNAAVLIPALPAYRKLSPRIRTFLCLIQLISEETVMGNNMIDVADALKLILDSVKPASPISVDFRESINYFTSEEIRSPATVPAFNNSAMDGYAVVFDDVRDCTEVEPAVLEVIEDLPAGKYPQREVRPGTATRIMTGAEIPAGADTVIQREHTDESDPDKVKILIAPSTAGLNVRYAGEDIRSQDVILNAGTRIRPQEVGLLASVGIVDVPVRPRPVVAVMPTGDEVVEPWEEPGPGGLRSSNSYTLSGQIEAAGAVSRYLGICGDDRESLRARLQKASDCDFILTTGGVSMGDYDYMLEVLDSIGLKRIFWKVAMKPGMPLLYGILNEHTHVFGLPGNPVSVMVTFEEFVRPAILKWMGGRRLFRPTVRVKLEEPVRKKAGRLNFTRGIVRYDADSGFTASTAGPQGSGILRSMNIANALLLLPKEATELPAGSEVTAHLLGLPEGSLETSDRMVDP